MGKTTRKLLRAATASAAGDGRVCAALVVELKARHKGEARRLVSDGEALFHRLENYFNELGKLLEGLAILGEVPPRGLDKILAYGELISSAIVSDALAARGVPTVLLDARELIKTNDAYGSAVPIFELTNRNICALITPLVEQGKVPVLQGFIGSTRSGATTTLGFEGSDYTAAIVGAALNADDIQIWKDVSGLMTADPAVYAGARTVKRCSYAEAAELTFFGAKVLHPKAIYPAAGKNIPVHIFNSKRPEATGTAISSEVPACANLIKSIAYKKPVKILYAAAGSTAETTGFIQRLLNACEARGLRPLMTAGCSSSVALVVDAGTIGTELERDLAKELSGWCTLQVAADYAVISLVGNELHRDAAAAARVVNAMDDLRPGIVLQGVSPITLNVVVSEDRVADVLARLHEEFFAELDPAIFE
jgi:aspartate kinase